MIPYGGGSADFAVYKNRLVPGQTYEVWSASTGGSLVTGIQDVAGVPLAGNIVVADGFGRVQFLGPNTPTPVYLKAVGDTSGLRVRMDPANLSATVASTASTVAGLSTTSATNTANIASNTSAINANTSNITANTTAINTANTNIATNTADIATHTSTLATHTTDIAARELLANKNATSGYAGLTGGRIAQAQEYAGPSLSVYRSGALTASNTAGQYRLLLWDAEEWQDNVSANAMHSTSSNTGRLIAPVTGKYQFTVLISVAAVLNTERSTLKVFINNSNTADGAEQTGSGFTRIAFTGYTDATTTTNNMQYTRVVKLTAGDYLTTWFTCSGVNAGPVGKTITAGLENTNAQLQYLGV